MGYVAISRARHDAIVYTNSVQELREALSRRVDKEMALEALSHSRSSAPHLHQGSLHGVVLHDEQQRSQDAFAGDTKQIDTVPQNPINQITHEEELGIEML